MLQLTRSGGRAHPAERNRNADAREPPRGGHVLDGVDVYECPDDEKKQGIEPKPWKRRLYGVGEEEHKERSTELTDL
jgi:hypothetical protein